MVRGDPSRTWEHGATSHLLRQDDVLIPGHEPPPLTARVLAPGVQLALVGRNRQLDERPRRHAASLSNTCSITSGPCHDAPLRCAPMLSCPVGAVDAPSGYFALAG